MIRSYDHGSLRIATARHPGRDVLVLLWSGAMSVDGAIAASNDVYSDPTISGTDCVMHDITALDLDALSATDVRELGNLELDAPGILSLRRRRISPAG